MNNSRIYTYQGYTLVDITNTGIIKYSVADEHQRNQQRNWETVVQLLGLRTQLLRIKPTGILHKDLNSYNFGSNYTGEHKIWVFEFDVEFQDIYKVGNNDFQILIDDFTQIPIITNLDETSSFSLPIFYSSETDKNIYFNFL
jgi:hypothetical protein